MWSVNKTHLIDVNALLEKLSCDTTYSMILRDLIEEQPVMICETIEGANIHEIGVFDIIDEGDFREHIKEDLAKEIGCFMMKKGVITFNEIKSSDKMHIMIKATAKVVAQMPKDGEKE